MTEDTQSFIVRIWHESANRSESASAWRGCVDHVGTGQRLYFCDLQGAVRFIEQQASMDPNRLGTGWRAWLHRIRRRLI